MSVKHDGDCPIYEHTKTGLPWCGFCLCGAGWREALRILRSDEISGGFKRIEALFEHAMSKERRDEFKASITPEDEAACKAMIERMCGCAPSSSKELEAFSKIVPCGSGTQIQETQG